MNYCKVTKENIEKLYNRGIGISTLTKEQSLELISKNKNIAKTHHLIKNSYFSQRVAFKIIGPGDKKVCVNRLINEILQSN